MALFEQIDADYKLALKAGDRLRVDALRMIKADVQRVTIDQKTDRLDDAGIQQVLARQVKQRRETLEAAKQSNRQDILTRTTEELAILTAYLPTPLPEAELARLIDEAVAAVGSQQRQVMKYVMSKAAGAADGATVSRLVASRLKASGGT